MKNNTEVTMFILAGLTDDPDLQIPLFILFLLIYLSTVLGNLGMIGLILLDSHLHTPMYFFLSHLSLVDLGYCSTVTPKVISGLLPRDKIISHNACGTQLFFFGGFIITEVFLLSSMAYDRYAAVCKPLHYTTTMTTNNWTCLTIGSYVCGFLNSSIHTGNVFRLSFCKSNVIDHFFCDAPPLLALSCSDTYICEIVIFSLGGFNVIFSIVVISISYLFIFITILRMRSSGGRQKAFSTCASHLTAVSIFYGTVIFMYLQPSSSHSMGSDKMASVFYTMVIPMLNPLVYSLRNKEVKGAFQKAVGRAKSTMKFIF
ncbi:olfactory receptor 5B12-like [Nannospalax galili]|uniref:olfactory receptor 5B12-like n=1 Tax=Nannospalax galili TaxID=1026970 RepID=UPI0004ED3368|nr:olfactory receptor 5B12-like [Nannospalax galili]